MAGYWKMVSTTVKENGVQSGEMSGLPPGDYVLVGWDLDTTGRRLLDEICQIAAFSPAVSFSQYVMPFRDLNPAARRRHNIRVVTVGRYRMLKDSKTGKVSCPDHITALTGDSCPV
jgi:maternal-effect protein exuperantia